MSKVININGMAVKVIDNSEKQGPLSQKDKDVETRVASGGRNVDKDKIISRYFKSLANIKQLIELCDILHVYDNTVEPVRIIRKYKADFQYFLMPNGL